MSKKLPLKAAVLGLIITLIVGFSVLLSSKFISQPTNKQDLRSRAAPSTGLYFSPSTINVSPSQAFSVDATINPGTNIVTAVELHVTFDPSKVQLNTVTPNTAYFPELLPNGEGERIKIDNAAGTASLIVGIGTSTTPVEPAVTKVATFNFAAKTAVSSSAINFTNETGASAFDEVTDHGISVNVITSKTGSSVNVSQQTTSTPTPTITIAPTNSPTPTPTQIITPTPTTANNSTGSVSASPNPCTANAQGICTSNITWTSSNVSGVCLVVDGTGLFACNVSGHQNAPWISTAGNTFVLYNRYNTSLSVAQNLASGNLQELGRVIVRATPAAATATPTPTPIPISCQAGSFNDNFETLNTSQWLTNVVSPVGTVNGTAVISAGKLNLTATSASASQRNDADVATTSQITGDFSIEAQVSNFTVPSGKSGSAEIAINNLERTAGINLAWRKAADGSSYVDLNSTAETGSTPQFSSKFTVGNVSSLKLRLVRYGTVAFGYVNAGSGYVPLGPLNNVFSGSGRLMLLAYSFPGSTGPTSASFDNFASVCPPTQPPVCLTSPIVDNFSNLNSWSPETDSGHGTVTLGTNSVNAVISGATDSDTARMISNSKLCGDFDVSIDFSNVVHPLDKNASATQLILETAWPGSGDSTDKYVYIDRGTRFDNNTLTQGFGTNTYQNGQFETWDGSKFQNSTALSGRLRIQRFGTTFYTYFNTGSGWKLLHTFKNGFSDPVYIKFDSGAWNPDHPNTSSTFSNFILNNISASTNLTLKLKLENITVKRSDVPVAITLTDSANQPVLTGTYNFVGDNSGVYTGVVNGIPAGTYNIKLKPLTFLSKKFTGQNLVVGATTIDVSATPFLGGDIDSENNTIDIFDYNRVVLDFGPRMPTTGTPADVDKNGSVDIFDYNEVVLNFSKSGDN